MLLKSIRLRLCVIIIHITLCLIVKTNHISLYQNLKVSYICLYINRVKAKMRFFVTTYFLITAERIFMKCCTHRYIELL